MEIASKILASLTTFTNITRLYELIFKDGHVPSSGLLVEAFLAVDELQAVHAREVIVLSSNGAVLSDKLLGQQATLNISLAGGTRTTFTGVISEAAMLGSTGSLVRYRLRLSSFLWPLSQSRNNCVWQNKSVIEIVESVLLRYPNFADWRWTEDVAQFMADVRPRSYCIQYRETDLDFITRLLGSEGLGWSMEEHAESVAGHRMVLFADSTQTNAFAEDATSSDSIAGQGIRYHNARAGEAQDTIQALAAAVSLGAASVTTLSYDYKAKKIVAASVPTNRQVGSMNAPQLESYDTPGLYAYAGADEAQRYARLQMEAMEAASQRWQARSTVRTLRPGTRFSLTQGPLGGNTETAPVYNVLRVVSMGINNLPGPAVDGLAELFGPVPELLEECMERITGNASADAGHRLTGSDAGALPGFGFADMIKQANSTGYANRIDMMDATLPWRPAILDASGTMLLPRATAPGSQSAIVVGPDGQTTASGPDELYCDKLGRVRIRFHWQGDQDDANATCWVRVAQRSAGGGMGAQFLPRIGQEVLVTFLENNIDRPLILGALYNGQGEGGQLPTPGGRSDQEADLGVFGHASDHTIGAQGNLAGGNSPHWHGASADSAGQRNSAAQSGMRSKEFGGSGYNQLLFDDTDQQGRTGLKSTQAATELTLGHMLHSADNFRGSFRGLGAELRTDAYGAVRAGAGLLLSTFSGTHGAQEREPAGDNAPAIAHMKQAMLLAQTFSTSALTHQAVALAGQVGSNKVDSSTIDPKAAPVKALYTATAGMLNRNSIDGAKAEAHGKPVEPGDDKLPHSNDSIIAIAAKAGIGVVAGQDLQLANRETTSLMSGQDTQLMTGGQTRIQSGQAIGLLGGVVEAGVSNVGLQFIAAKNSVDLQAQADGFAAQARDQVNVISANAHIDWAAAKSISLSTAGGANITISGGNITVQCPGKITIKAGTKSFVGPERAEYPLPYLPVANPKDAYSNRLDAHDLFVQHPFGAVTYAAKLPSGRIMKGVLDEHGRSTQIYASANEEIEILVGHSLDEWDAIADIDPNESDDTGWA
jgi:type VI secretion system secreted protein VgrG